MVNDTLELFASRVSTTVLVEPTHLDSTAVDCAKISYWFVYLATFQVSESIVAFRPDNRNRKGTV